MAGIDLLNGINKIQDAINNNNPLDPDKRNQFKNKSLKFVAFNDIMGVIKE